MILRSKLNRDDWRSLEVAAEIDHWQSDAMKIYKDKLSPGYSYPLKPSVLAKLIEERRVKTPASLYQWDKRSSPEGVIFSAGFYPPGGPGGYGSKGYETEIISIVCRSVPSSERHAARIFLEESVFPAFADWILDIEKLPANSTVRREKQLFTRSWPPTDLQADVR